MVHTFELSKRFSRDTFNEIIRSLKLRYYLTIGLLRLTLTKVLPQFVYTNLNVKK